MPPASPPIDITAVIGRRDRAFRSVIAEAGPPPQWRSARVDERYAALVRSITFQLLATNAADTIHGRVRDLCDGRVTVDAVLAAGADRLRAAGLSRTKAQAMVDLAEGVRDGRVRLGRHGRMSDAEVVADVTAVRGIGPWTAQMYLMHTLARPDVWPAGDFGVRNGWTILHDLDEIIAESDLRAEGEKFAGVRSAVAWYCWQAVHFSRRAN
jgi:DNA-3-methyladenine glycosylase II